MMNERPDLSQVSPQVRAYIEALEAEVEQLRQAEQTAQAGESRAESEPSEPPSSFNLVTISAGGFAKRTLRHLYSCQRRGGMGVFDLETTKGDAPAFLVMADESQSLLLVTNMARAFRMPVRELPESPVHSRGQSLLAPLALQQDERLAVVVADMGQGYIILVSERGYVRSLRHQYVGENLRPGATLYNVKEFGCPVAACWTQSEIDLFIATRQGRAIRFPLKQVPLQGGLGIRLEGDDTVVAATAVRGDSSVVLLGADGRGTLRLMSGFSANKAPGGSGKIAIKSDCLVGAATVIPSDHVFILSRLGKLIRFRAVEIPPTEGAVQGVNCMSLRADEIVAMTVGPALY